MKTWLLTLLMIACASQTIRAQQGGITDREIRVKKIVNCSLDTVWWKMTTHEGLLTFFGKQNKVELTPGGAYEIYFTTDQPDGKKGGEGCTVLSFVPKQMLSFTWNAPPQFKEIRESKYHTWVVVFFRKVSDKQTEVELVHYGWLKGKNWDDVYAYFGQAWPVVLDWLGQSCK